MAVRVASETTRQIFFLAAGEGNDARIEKPGISGLVVLLQSQLTDYEIAPEDIGAVFVALSLDEDCSFTYDEFETFVNRLFGVESVDEDSVSGEAERIAADVCSLADTIAERCARNDFPLIAPSELLSPMETGAAETTLSLTEKYEYVQLQSYLESQKANIFLASPMEESTPHAVQEAICQREYYYVWMRRFLLEKSFTERCFAHRMRDECFLPLIPTQSVGLASKRIEACEIVALVTAEMLPKFDEELWSSWSKQEEVLKFLDTEPVESFQAFVNDEYFPIMKRVAETVTPKVASFVPRVPVEHDASPSEMTQRIELLLKIDFADGTEAEKRVVEKWNRLVEACEPSMRSLLTLGCPSLKFWQKELYKSLFEVSAEKSLRDAGNNLGTDMYKPRVAAEVGGTGPELEQRIELLTHITASAGAEAERMVVRSWKKLYESCEPSVQDMLKLDEPTEKFWQQHLYKALHDVYTDSEGGAGKKKTQEAMYEPRVAPKIGVSPLEMESRVELLKHITASSGAKAEKKVLLKWNKVIESCDSSLRDMFTLDEPTEKIWQEHLYDALKDVAHCADTSKVSGPAMDGATHDEATASSVSMGLDALIAGRGSTCAPLTLQPFDFISSAAVMEAAPKTKCKYEGTLVYNDDATRTVKDNYSASPQKRKQNTEERTVLDMFLVDKTGPVFVSLWDEAAASFLDQLNALQASSEYDTHNPVSVSLSLTVVTAITNNDWNGPCLTSMRTLHSANTAGGRAGTEVILGGNPSSPHLTAGSFSTLSREV